MTDQHTIHAFPGPELRRRNPRLRRKVKCGTWARAGTAIQKLRALSELNRAETNIHMRYSYQLRKNGRLVLVVNRDGTDVGPWA